MINHHFSGVSPCAMTNDAGCGSLGGAKGKFRCCSVPYLEYTYIYNNRCDLMNANWSCVRAIAIVIYRLYYVHEYQHIYVCGTARKYTFLWPGTGTTTTRQMSWSGNGNGSGQAVKVSWNHKRKSRTACEPLEASGVAAMIFNFTPESHALIFSSLDTRTLRPFCLFIVICHTCHRRLTLNWH